MTDKSTDDTDRIPPLNLTAEETNLLYWVVSSFNDGGAFPEGTDDFETWENIRQKVERNYHRVNTETDQ